MKRIPIGISNFKDLMMNDYYYIDKTEWINDVLDEYVTLYTRPRRFGKTLNMSMLYHFFSNREDGKVFEGLKITHHKEAMKHMNQYPVLFITLKDMENTSFSDQIAKFKSIISQLIIQNIELLTSPHLIEFQKKMLNHYLNRESDIVDLKEALVNISICLKQHYNQNVIILIDEYDVPLKSAYTNGYYDEMVGFLKGTFSATLKDNDFLQKGILTGCLRVSRESIFTGLNNFKVNSIVDGTQSHAFGFTQDEIDKLLRDYGLDECKEEVKEWYDGYLFGETDIYNPWSSIMYVDKKLIKPKDTAISFWANTSSNQLVIDYIQRADDVMRKEFEELMSGKPITKYLELELTYKDMDELNNVYSFLFLTGYLKITRKVENHVYELVIPNREVREIYQRSFMKYFRSYVETRKSDFVNALLEGNASIAQKLLGDILFKHVSYFDNQENFYHGLLMGILSDYGSDSNKEIGEGRPDIVIYPRTYSDKVIVIECKHSNDEDDIVGDSDKAARQIVEKKYQEGVLAKGYEDVIGYGIAFYKKLCKITLVK